MTSPRGRPEGRPGDTVGGKGTLMSGVGTGVDVEFRGVFVKSTTLSGKVLCRVRIGGECLRRR